MSGDSLIKDFAVVLAVAGVTGLIFRRLGLSAVVGYLFAGLIIGPYTPPFSLVDDVDRINQLSQIGLVFLMFFVGMGLSLDRIRKLGAATVLATAITAWMVFNLCYLLSLAMGWETIQVLFFAAIFMVSSSAIIVKMLSESGETHERFALRAQGVTVLEDLVAIIMITLLSSQIQFSAAEPGQVGKTLAMLGSFVVLVMVVGLLFLPRMLSRFAKSADSDLKVVFVSGMLFASALAALLAGFSVALGAFLFGVIVSETPLKSRVEKSLGGTQDIFGAVFFVSIGMLIDLRIVWENGFLILGLTLFALCSRVLAATVACLITGNSWESSIRAALILIPIGEFSYVIAQLGVSSGNVPDYFYALAVAASLASAITAPILLRHSESIAGFVQSRIPKKLLRAVEDYGLWLESTLEKREKMPWWKLTRARLGQVAVEILLLAGTLNYSRKLYPDLVKLLAEAGITVPGLLYLYMGVVALICATLLIAAWRNWSAISMIYAEALAGKDRLKRKLLQNAQQLAGTVFLAWVFVVSMPGKITESWLSILFILLVTVFIVVLWRRLVRWQSAVQHSLNTAITSSGSSGASALVVQPKDWNVEVIECILPELASVRGQSPAMIGLRARFGCALVEIERQGVRITNPRPDTLLFPGDTLLLFGTEEQTTSARRFLLDEKEETESEKDFDAIGLQTLRVPEGSPRLGSFLRDLGLTETLNAQILGIRRGKQEFLNPSGKDVLLADDELLVLTSDSGAERFRSWLKDGTV